MVSKEQFIEANYSKLLKIALGVTGYKRELTEDLLQNALIKFLATKTDIEDYKNYIIMIIRNDFYHWYRTDKKRQHADFDNEADFLTVVGKYLAITKVIETPFEAYRKKEFVANFKRATSKKLKLNNILQKIVLEDYSYKELSDETGENRETLASHVKMFKRRTGGDTLQDL